MKRYSLLILTALFLISTLFVVPVFADKPTGGTCGDALTWEMDTATGTLTVSGTGEMTNYASFERPWKRLNFDVTTLIIEEGVTNVSDCAFLNFQNLTTVKLPSTIKSIGAQSFERCHALVDINLPDSLEELGPGAFEWTGLKSVTIPPNVTVLSSNLFNVCFDLTEVILHENISVIGSNVFTGTKVSQLDLPEDLLTLGGVNSEIISITLPQSITDIGGCFNSAHKLEEVILSDNITVLDYYAFNECVSLKAIDLPTSLEEIRDGAFQYCGSLTEVEIPDRVTVFGRGVFMGCGSLKSIKFTGRAPLFSPESFIYSELDVYYPAGYSTWTEDVLQDYGGTINWIPYETDIPEPHEHSFGDWQTLQEPTPTELGWQESLCQCGESKKQPLPKTANPFDDVTPGEYYYESVLWAVSQSITTGTSDTTFSPNEPCTRGQVVTFLWRAAGSPEPESLENPFTDVAQSDYFYTAVLWAVEKGITNGMTDTTFTPSDPCTRAQVATFLWRSAGEPGAASGEHSFLDIRQDYYYDAVLWAVEQGITQGTSPVTFAPAATCTRAQIVTFLYRFLA